MRRLLRNITPLLFFILLPTVTGCIKNDIPYPRIQPNVLEISVADASRPAAIDSINRAITVYLDEVADIYNVEVLSCRISPGACWVGDSIGGSIDLSSPRFYTLRIYQDYVWSIRAEQTIERSFAVANQVGASIIDVPARRIIVTVPETVDIRALTVTSCKLGSSNATIDPDISAGSVIDLSRPLEVDVTDYGRTARWIIYVDVTETVVTTQRVDAWTNVAWVYGEAQEGRTNSVEYRRADENVWTRVPDAWLYSDGGSFYARLIHLDSLTEYVARAVSNDDYGQELHFTTGAIIQMPNSDFENWWLDGKVWCPWAEGATPYWGTGNKGATTLGSSNTYPSDDTPTGTGKSACLETRFVGIGIIGKLAAGNIFAGDYLRTEGTNGVLSFGRDFSERPTRLRGYYKYTTAPISSTSSGFEDLKGEPDTGVIWCALIDSAEPFEIRTNPSNRQLFDPEGSYVVAYGRLERNSDTPGWQNFEIELKYNSTDRVPRYILCVASASFLGDYFTGGNGAVMYVDDFELLYDY